MNEEKWHRMVKCFQISMTEALIKFDQLLKCNIVDVSNKRTDNGVATAKKKKTCSTTQNDW